MLNSYRNLLLAASLLALSSTICHPEAALAQVKSNGTFTQTINVTATGGGPFSIGSQAKSDPTTVPMSVDPSQNTTGPPVQGGGPEGAGTEASSGSPGAASSGQDSLGQPISHPPDTVFGAPAIGNQPSNADFIQDFGKGIKERAIAEKMNQMQAAILKRMKELGSAAQDNSQQYLQGMLQQLQQAYQQYQNGIDIQSEVNQLSQKLVDQGIIQRIRNDQALQQAIGPPDDTSTSDVTNDDPNAQMNQAFKDNDYHKIRDLAPEVHPDDPVQHANDLVSARNMAIDRLQSGSMTPDQQADALRFLGGVEADLRGLANGTEMKSPKNASIIRTYADGTNQILNGIKDQMNR